MWELNENFFGVSVCQTVFSPLYSCYKYSSLTILFPINILIQFFYMQKQDSLSQFTR